MKIETKFELDITKIEWDSTFKEILKMCPYAKVYDNEMYLSGKINEIKINWTLIFSKWWGKLKRIEITIVDIIENATAGSEVDDFLKSFNVLENFFGKPDVISGISLLSSEEIKKILSAEKLYPQIVWFINNSMIIHTFRDHWGIIPYTYIIKKRK